MIDGGLRRTFHKAIPAFWQAIETGSIGTAGCGVPDSHYIFEGNTSGWVEYKKVKAFAIKFSPEQVAWIDKYTRYGGRVWIGVRQIRVEGQRTTGQDNLWIIQGKNVKALNNQGLKQFISKEEMKKLETPGETLTWRNIDMSITAQVWSGGPRHWDWGTIEKLLRL